MLASSNVNIAVLAKHNEFLKPETANVNLRRNYIVLFDSTQTEAVKLDCSIGVSLVDREHQDRLMGKVQNSHPLIPGAKITGKEDRGPLHMQKPQPHEVQRIAECIQIAQPTQPGPKAKRNEDLHDPQLVIKAGKAAPPTQEEPAVD